ncbi:MAG: tRNA pseudouridine(55) synthase TruB [Sporichthyaceae bacterium]|nr:tRNA pseudouridine(55) synthase TruB [Sporichthyaceae bacterium]
MTTTSPSSTNRRPANMDGLVVVDKPAGWTSHDVVGKIRRLAGTRRVGHAGTLDPMATGVLLVGVDRATRLLGHLALTEKEYAATIRLGQTTVTDDAEGELTDTASAERVRGVTEAAIRAGMAELTGQIQQVPAAVSAIKVAGKRSYARVRGGEQVELAARPVTVHAFDLVALRTEPSWLDLDVTVTCSSGTYVRALARDLGAGLGIGGHLTALRRTRVGPYPIDQARTISQLEAGFSVLPLAEAVAAAFPVRTVSSDEAVRLSHGGKLAAAGIAGTYAAFAPDGGLLALLTESGGQAKPVAVFAPA